MSEETKYTDPTGLDKVDYDQEQVSPEVKKHVKNVRIKMYGRHVRESISRAIEFIDLISQKAVNIATKAFDKSEDTENRLDNQLKGLTSDSEIIDLRYSKMLKKNFNILKDRGDFWDESLSDININIKWITNNGLSLNDAISLVLKSNDNLNILVPSGQYFLDGPITIDREFTSLIFSKGVEIEVKPPKHLKETDEYYPMLSLGGETELGRINIQGGVFNIPQIEGFTTIGILINNKGAGNSAIVDSSLFDIRIVGADIGILSRFSWCIDLRNVRLQSCKKPLQMDSQSNNFEFLRCSFVTFSESNTYWNVEAVNFSSCEFANAAPTLKEVNQIFQSSVSFESPYIEYLQTESNEDIAFLRIGSYNDKAPSTVRCIGGKSTDKEINILHVSEYPVSLDLYPPQRGKFNIKAYEAGQTSRAAFTEMRVPSNLSFVKVGDYIKFYDGSTEITWEEAWGGGNVLKTFDNKTGETTIKYTGTGGANGIKVTGLTKGEKYTLAYNSTTGIPIKNGDMAGVKTKETGDDLHYLVFEANSDTIRFELSPGNSFSFGKLAILKGAKFPIF